MAKKKSQKKFSSTAENPFNIKVNRSKHSVLGLKVKGTRGLPGISHSVSNARRKEEFHKKKVLSQKTNKFLDKRLMDNTLSYEEQVAARFIEERKKKFKKNIFNLNDEEGLTHKGIPLEKHKNFNDVVMDSDDDEQLDPMFVKQAHFGGFTGDSTSVPKTRKEIIDELIIESKKRKQERKLDREKQLESIEKLDQQWKEIHKTLPRAGKKEKVMPEKNDPFDILLNELKFEIKATPANQVKTAEEIAREEEMKLKKLEEERKQRMIGPFDEKQTADNHLSADSIYDGLDIQLDTFDEQTEGKSDEKTSDNSDDEESGDDSSDDSENEIEINDNVQNDKMESLPIFENNAPEIPSSMESFCNIIGNHTEGLYAILENILKDNIKTKSKQKVEKLENFFIILLKYSMKTNSLKRTLDVLEDTLPHLYDLANVSLNNIAHLKVLELLDEEEEFFQQCKGKKMKRNFPRIQSLVLFKIISAIYSVSDFKHSVVTPAIILMCDVLSSAFAVSLPNIASRLFICNIIYDCVSYSKRYVPEVLWFLNKTLLLAIDNNKKVNIFVDEAVTTEERVELSIEKSGTLCDNNVKVSILYEVFELLFQFSALYEPLQSYKEIFSPLLEISNKLPTANFPNFLKGIISKFISAVESVKNIYKPLMFENKKPVPLKLFEPIFDSKYTMKKDDIQKKRKLIKNVNQKIRKEEKGLLREMRRDNQVIASEKLKEQLAADEERKRKVKQIYHELAMQEGEYKKFIKKKLF